MGAWSKRPSTKPLKTKVEKLLETSESDIKTVCRAKKEAVLEADAKALDKKAVDLRNEFDKKIAGLLNAAQVDDWTKYATIDFFEDTIIGDEALFGNLADGGPGLNLTDKQTADLKAVYDTRGNASEKMIQAPPELREASGADVMKANSTAREKLRGILSVEQKKKYDQWIIDQLKSFRAQQAATTKP